MLGKKIISPRASIWIDSSAGCGKTTLLVRRVISLLVQKQKNILCITFTKVAASEMYNRIFDALARFASSDVDTIHSLLLKEFNYEERFDYKHVQSLLYHIDELLTIQTLHSFCLSSLKKLEPYYNFISISDENQQIFNKLLSLFIFDLCELNEKTSETITEHSLIEILKSLIGQSHLKYSSILGELRKKNLPHTYEVIRAFSEFREYARSICRNYISHNEVIHTAVEKKIWDTYEISGQIDHLLVDEAQDNNCVQWGIIYKLCQNLLCEASDKSLFIVGDYKQSIYSFQGSEPELFFGMREALKAIDHSSKLEIFKIEKSYRSAQPILEFVDAVFKHTSLCEVYKEEITHITNRESASGFVYITQFIEATTTEESEKKSAKILAYNINNWIIDQRKLPNQNRLISPGDIAVLVAHRTAFIDHLYQELSSIGIPVNFTGSIKLKENKLFELLLSIGKFIVFRDDDKSLIHILTSPLFSMSHNVIMQIKFSQPGKSLFEILKDTEIGFILQNSFNNCGKSFQIYSNFLSSEVAANIYSIYGKETEYYIDIFLDSALEYPCIYDFMHHLSSNDARLKVTSSNSAGITISTIHGSKGKQYPIVFVADTNYVPQNRDTFLYENNVPILTSESAIETKELIKKKLHYEHTRLLYVALTRASDELFIIGNGITIKTSSWYPLCKKSIKDIGVANHDGSFFFTNDPNYNGMTLDYLNNNEENTEVVHIPDNEHISLPDHHSFNTQQENFNQKIVHLSLEQLANNTTAQLNQSSNLHMHQSPDFEEILSAKNPLHNAAQNQEIANQSVSIKNEEHLNQKKGEILHKILEYLSHVHISDIINHKEDDKNNKQPANWLDNFLLHQCFELDDKEEIKKRITSFIKNNEIIQDKKEVEILHEGKLLRMDSIIERDSEVIIRDYKTGTIDPSLVHAQMQRYCEALKTVFPDKIIKTEIITL